MLLKIAHWLHNRGGFWFPAVTWIIGRIFRAFSLGHLINALLEKKRIGGPWVSELYQFFWILFGLCWIALIERPVLTAIGWIIFGFVVACYRIFEILIFSLHWVLVAKDPVESYRRSLLGFIVNLCEIGIFFAIAYLLFAWFDPPQGAWSALFESIRSVFSLELVSGLREALWPKVFARLQLCISWILVVFVIANVVGAIGRNEKVATSRDDSV